MVRAILEGRKTVTRRTVRPAGADHIVPFIGADNRPTGEFGWCPHPSLITKHIRPPYQVGDRLYVRETTVNVEDHGYLGPVFAVSDEGVAIREGGLGPAEDDCEIEPEDIRLRPALHMPKAWARIWLEVTDVRVERLQDITEEQARAEGADWNTGVEGTVGKTSHVVTGIESFSRLWDGLAKEGTRWADNPWVWVVEFKRLEMPNGD